MLGAPSFSQPDLCIQPTLQSQPRNSFSTSANSHLRIPLLFTKSSLQSPLILPVSIPQQFFTSLCAQPSQQFTPKMFYLPQSFRQFRLRQQTRELGSLLRTDTVLISLFCPSMGSDNRAHDSEFFIAQIQKIYTLQVWQAIQSTVSRTLNLLSLLPYPFNSTTRTHISLQTSCIT